MKIEVHHTLHLEQSIMRKTHFVPFYLKLLSFSSSIEFYYTLSTNIRLFEPSWDGISLKVINIQKKEV